MVLVMLFGADLLSSSQITNITSALTGFGNMVLDAFIQILPALAVIAAIWFVLKVIANKVN